MRRPKICSPTKRSRLCLSKSTRIVPKDVNTARVFPKKQVRGLWVLHQSSSARTAAVENGNEPSEGETMPICDVLIEVRAGKAELTAIPRETTRRGRLCAQFLTLTRCQLCPKETTLTIKVKFH